MNFFYNNSETKESEHVIRILSWNISSYKPGTWNLLQSYKPDIICLQEIRKAQPKIRDKAAFYNVITNPRQTNSGGGTAILARKTIYLSTPTFMNDSICLRCCASSFSLFIINIYQSEGIQHCLTNIESMLYSIYSGYPNAEIIIIGDFNYEMKKQMKSTPIQEFTQKWDFQLLIPCGPTFRRIRKEKEISSTLDFVMYSKKLKGRYVETLFTHLSDHRPLVLEIKIPSESWTERKRIIWKKNRAVQYCTNILSMSHFNDPLSFLNTLRHGLEKSRRKITQIIAPSYARKLDSFLITQRSLLQDEEYLRFITENWSSTISQIQNYYDQRETRQFFKMIENMTKYSQFEKRDGAIVSVLRDENGKLIVDPERVDLELVDFLRTIQGELKISQPSCKMLLPLTDQETLNILDKMSNDKAISYDLIPDFVFHFNFENKVKILKSLWTIPLDQINPRHFEARLVALNKVYPEIPTKGDFRPIIVMSPIIKFLEARFLPKLMNYCKNKMLPSQIGFVEGLGCDINIRRIITRGVDVARNSNVWVLLFIDFKSAYNTVNRDILYQKLIDKDILTVTEVEWLHDLHAKIQIRSGKASLRPKNGLHQGSMISPLLFDIYVEPIIAGIHSRFAIPLEDILFYADDLAVICTRDQVNRVIDLIEKISKQLSLILNKKKSGVVIIRPNHPRTRKPVDKCFAGIPVVDKYKYLGVEIDSSMGIGPYISKIQKKSKFIYSKLCSILWNSEPETRRALWVALIRPLFDYVFPIYDNLSTGLKKRLLSQMRLLFKRFLGLRKNFPNRILYIMIGNIHSYINYRIQCTKSKLAKRFNIKMTSSRQMDDYPILFPPLDLIPSGYLHFLNILDGFTCNLCNHDRRLTWKHLSFHQIVIRNPDLVMEFKINQWESMRRTRNNSDKLISKQNLITERNIWAIKINYLMELIYTLL